MGALRLQPYQSISAPRAASTETPGTAIEMRAETGSSRTLRRAPASKGPRCRMPEPPPLYFPDPGPRERSARMRSMALSMATGSEAADLPLSIRDSTKSMTGRL